MVSSLIKFIGIWLAVMLLAGLAMFATSGGGSTLNAAIQNASGSECTEVAGGFGVDVEEARDQCLTQAGNQLEERADTANSNMLFWHAITGTLVLLVGVIFIIRIVQRAQTAAGVTAVASMKGAWMVHMLIILVVTIATGILSHFGPVFGGWAADFSIAKGWGIPAAMVVGWCVTYWLGTILATPDKMKPSIPGG